jgi:hypothetical protein
MLSVAQTAVENVWQHHFVEPGGGGDAVSFLGLTACEDNNTLRIFRNFSNIHNLLRVIYGSHFSTFSGI